MENRAETNYLFVVSPFKSVNGSDLKRMEKLGPVFELEEQGDFRTQLEATLKSGEYGDVGVLVSYAGDGGSLKVAEVAQNLNLPFMSLPAGTGNDIPIALFDYREYDKLSKKETRRLRDETLTAIENNSLDERQMDTLLYTAYAKDAQLRGGQSYIGHHLHLVAKAGQMDGVWSKAKKLGPIAYVLRGVAGIIKQNPTDFTVTLKGKNLEELMRWGSEPQWHFLGESHEFSEDVWGGQVLNTETTGGGKLRIEGESAYDGAFSFMYIPTDLVSKRQLFGLSSKLDKSIYLDGVKAVRGIEEMIIESESGFDWGVDGETSGDLFSDYGNGSTHPTIHKLEIKIKPGALKVYVPIISQEL